MKHECNPGGGGGGGDLIMDMKVREYREGKQYNTCIHANH